MKRFGDRGISAAQLQKWVKALGFNNNEARTVLGIRSYHTWMKYRDNGADRSVAYACAYLLMCKLAEVYPEAEFSSVVRNSIDFNSYVSELVKLK